MINITKYSNYREFLKDYYDFKKSSSETKFSYRILAKEVGFKDAGFFTRILNGQKNISEEMINRFIAYFNFEKREAQYFEALVYYNQAKKHDVRKLWLGRLLKYKDTKLKVLGKENFKFYEKWYYTTIREILNYYPYKGNSKELAKLVEPTIRPQEAEEAVLFLEESGLIKKKKNGTYILMDKFVDAPPDIAPVSVHSYQIATMDLAKRALDKIPKEEREINTLTLSLSDQGMENVKQILRDVRKQLIEVAKNDRKVDKVCQINMQAFPTSKNKQDKKS